MIVSRVLLHKIYVVILLYYYSFFFEKKVRPYSFLKECTIGLIGLAFGMPFLLILGENPALGGGGGWY